MQEATKETKLKFAILQYLDSVHKQSKDNEGLEVTLQLLGSHFGLDINDEEQKKKNMQFQELWQMYLISVFQHCPKTKILKYHNTYKTNLRIFSHSLKAKNILEI